VAQHATHQILVLVHRHAIQTANAQDSNAQKTRIVNQISSAITQVLALQRYQMGKHVQSQDILP
jgi:hypothetical protein